MTMPRDRIFRSGPGAPGRATTHGAVPVLCVLAVMGSWLTGGVALARPAAVAPRSTAPRSAAPHSLPPPASGPAPAVAYGALRTLLSGDQHAGGIAVDSQGDVFMAYAGSAQVVEIAKGQTQAVPVVTGVASPYGVAVDGAGDVFVTDYNGGPVYEKPAGGVLTALPFTGLVQPTGVAVDGAGDVFVSDVARVLELPKGGSQTVLPFPALSNAGGLAVDGAGDVFVADSGHRQVLELPSGGSSMVVPLAGVDDPTAVALDSAGDVFVSAVNLGVIERSKDGTQSLLGFPGIFGAAGVAVDGAGDVFVTDPGTNRVEMLPPGGTAGLFPPNALSAPNGLAVDGAGDVFVSDFTESLVLELPVGGTATRLAFTGLNHPAAVALDGAGDVFVADTGNNRVVELVKGGGQLTLGFHGLLSPTGLAVDGAGDVFVTGVQNGAVVELPSGGAQVTVPLIGLHNPVSLAVDGDGNLFVADAGIHILDAGPGYEEQPQLVELPGAGRGNGIGGAGSGFGPGSGVGRRGAQVAVAIPALTGFDAVAVDRAGDLFVSGIPASEADLPFAAGVSSGVASTDGIVEVPRGGGVSSETGFSPATSQNGLAVDDAGDLFLMFQFANEVQELPVDQALFVNPVNGQLGVDTTAPFRWTTAPGAQAYYLIVGTTLYGNDLVDSGVLAPSQSSFTVPVLPSGQLLYATLFTEENGSWSRFQVVGFTAAAQAAAFTSPRNGQFNVDTTRPFTWTGDSAGQGYILVVGTTRFGHDLVDSGPLPAGQRSFAVPPLPGGVLYATLLTKVGGTYQRFQAVSFTAASGGAVFTHPLAGQLYVDSTAPFTWSRAGRAQGYQLSVGTTVYGHDLVDSPVLPPGVASYPVPALPAGKVLYATLYTETNGTWVNFNLVGFTATLR